MIEQFLAIDPGITTGYALLDRTGELLQSGNLDMGDLIAGDTCIEEYSHYNKPEKVTLVIIEEIPKFANSQLGRDLREIIEYLSRLFPNATWIRPTDWKSIGPVANHPLPPKWADEPYTTHEKDAFRIGVYYITRRGVINGESNGK